MTVDYYIGTSGWHYDDWKGRFYPEKLARTRWLEFYAREFSTVELNNTFYRLPSENAVKTWHDAPPAGFTFSVKASRYITHIKRLRGAEESVGAMFERIGFLEDKLGPVLYQLPPSMNRDDAVLEKFLAILPPDERHVFEFRHESWLEEGVFDILGKHNAGFCIFDQPDVPCPVVATSDFAYIRFHGSGDMYSSSYSDDAMSKWAKRIQELAHDLESVYIYFNNDVRGYAVDNSRTLRGYLVEHREP
jgi:uncharacterized protein YecE (DUF72 family)